MLGFLLITKQEAFFICDKTQYNESSTWEQIKLKIRYLWCPATRIYVTKNNNLTHKIQTSSLSCLSAAERKMLEKNLKKHLDQKMQ